MITPVGMKRLARNKLWIIWLFPVLRLPITQMTGEDMFFIFSEIVSALNFFIRRLFIVLEEEDMFFLVLLQLFKRKTQVLERFRT